MKISISHLPIMIDMNYFINNTYIIKDVPEEYFVRGVFMEYMGNEIPY